MQPQYSRMIIRPPNFHPLPLLQLARSVGADMVDSVGIIQDKLCADLARAEKVREGTTCGCLALNLLPMPQRAVLCNQASVLAGMAMVAS